MHNLDIVVPQEISSMQLLMLRCLAGHAGSVSVRRRKPFYPCCESQKRRQ